MLNTMAVVLDTSGTNGAATGSAQSGQSLMGDILAIHLSFPSTVTQANGTVVVGGGGVGMPADTFLSVTGSQASVSQWFYPRRNIQTSAGVLASYSSNNGAQPVPDHFVMYDNLKVSAGGFDAITGAVTARIIYRN